MALLLNIVTEYNFVNNPVQTTSIHFYDGQQILKQIDNFEYDPMQRLLRHTQKVNNQSEELIAENAYDELGQLVQKKVGGAVNGQGLQEIDYHYNIRGWLTGINNPDDLGNSLFGFKIYYNHLYEPDLALVQVDMGNPKELFNGNISQKRWKTFWDSGSYEIGSRGYSYNYDALNRITGGHYFYIDGINNVLSPTKYRYEYHLQNVKYDANGNILSLRRTGLDQTTPSQTNIIDDLTYFYQDKSNQLLNVKDIAGDDGFKDGNDGQGQENNDYHYDLNGNMVIDRNKGISEIAYNHLNLPEMLSFSLSEEQDDTIHFVYDATGNKLQKTVTAAGTTTTTDYANGLLYKNGQLQFASHPEGYLEPKANGTLEYVYQYTDHLGNIRLSYKKGSSDELIVVEENNYYPFGLRHEGYNNLVDGEENPYLYNGKELNEELGLGWYDYGARFYEPTLGRWMTVDPLAEKYAPWSPYNYVLGNPVRLIDPDGRAPDDIIYLDSNNKEIYRVAQKGAHVYYQVDGNSNDLFWPGMGDGSDPCFSFTKVESPVTISFRDGVNQDVVSVQSRNALQDIGLESRVFDIDVTSTSRDARGQATAMYNNLVTNYDEQRGIYRAPGQAVIDAYDAAVGDGLNRVGVIEAMTNTINDLDPQNVSRHAANPNELNVLDISQRNIPTNLRQGFMNAANRRDGVRMLNENSVFHIEINQD